MARAMTVEQMATRLGDSVEDTRKTLTLMIARGQMKELKSKPGYFRPTK